MPANERDERLARALFADVQVLSNTKVPFPIEYNSSVLILLFTSISWKQVGHLRWKFLFFPGSQSVNDIFATKMTVMPGNILSCTTAIYANLSLIVVLYEPISLSCWGR